VSTIQPFEEIDMSNKTPRSTVLAGLLSGIITTAAFTGTSLAFSSAAHAATPDGSLTVPGESAQVVVRYDRQTLETSDGTRALYRRIVRAAEQVCPDVPGDPHHFNESVRACRAQSVARAVQSIGNERLAALHQASLKQG
jgi:UrcA family protein